MGNINYYKTNKLPIPFEFTKQYKIGVNNKISYKCKECGFEFSCKYGHLKYRRIRPDENICNNCINKLEKSNLGPSVPDGLKQYSGKDNPIPWGVFIKYKDNYISKKWINIKCTECNEKAIVQWAKISSRKYAKNQPICSKCIGKYTANLDDWKKVNSEAQKIAQNKPGAREHMRITMNDKIKNDIEFRRKITRYSGKLCGYYNGIKFDSSWELSVIHYYGDKIKACEIVIPYIFDNKERLYLPDFELYENNKKYLVEVKGQYRDSDYAKIEAANNSINNKLINYDEFFIINKYNIKKLEGIILFDSMDKLRLLNQNELKILRYPKSWLK